MAVGANLAGKAINISKTIAPHAFLLFYYFIWHTTWACSFFVLKQSVKIIFFTKKKLTVILILNKDTTLFFN